MSNQSGKKDVKTCGTCKHRISGFCESEKLGEDWGQSDNDRADMLMHDPHDGGGFLVGERFGCAHHEGKQGEAN